MTPHQWFGECVLPAVEGGHLSGKRLEAVLKVWAALTKMDEEPDLPRVRFFAPQLGTLGLSMPERVFDAPIIYLNPVLEMETLGVVGHVVAHEIAHHTHGHLRLGEKNWMERREAEANVTAAVWRRAMLCSTRSWRWAAGRTWRRCGGTWGLCPTSAGRRPWRAAWA